MPWFGTPLRKHAATKTGSDCGGSDCGGGNSASANANSGTRCTGAL